MWFRDLLSRLKVELPRWRWKSHLTNRGGILKGQTQKQSLHIEIEYARGHWILNAHGLLGRKQPQWTLLIEEGKFSSLDDLVDMLVLECIGV